MIGGGFHSNFGWSAEIIGYTYMVFSVREKLGSLWIAGNFCPTKFGINLGKNVTVKAEKENDTRDLAPINSN